MYDFFGIPPQGDDASHAMSGLYLSRPGFGGKIIHRYGAWDGANSSVVVCYLSLGRKNACVLAQKSQKIDQKNFAHSFSRSSFRR